MNQPIVEVIEDCRQRLARGERIEDCLAAYPAHAAELRQLLPIAARVQRLGRDPDPARVEAARRRFQERLAVARQASLAASAPRPGGWLQRLAVPLAIVLILLLSGVGLVQAAGDALPDSPLYSVKQAQEDVARVFAWSPDRRAAIDLRLAGQRLRELEAAERLGKGPAVQRGLATRMVEQTTLATQQILQSNGAHRSTLIALYRPLVARELRALDRLTASPHPDVAATARQLRAQLLDDRQSLLGE